MVKILVAFYSRNGSTELLANAIADGAREEKATLRVRRCREVVPDAVMTQVPGWAEAARRMNEAYQAPTPEDAEWADAIILGSPTRFGLVCSEVKAFIDGLGGLWSKGALAGKVGSAFSSTATRHGGNELTNFTLFAPFAHLGMIIVPPGYTDSAMYAAGTPYGATSVSAGSDQQMPTDVDLEAARYQGRRVASVAAKLRG
ncbi:MAG: NAD(P)H:quinone oxidoreductase [Henriciella sp.]|uniref:NAD(P)H:quinone oxidoreductase n=1 Tax=Henriciella sp. TaxID=1968823 RepID=UPI003C72999A